MPLVPLALSIVGSDCILRFGPPRSGADGACAQAHAETSDTETLDASVSDGFGSTVTSLSSASVVAIRVLEDRPALVALVIDVDLDPIDDSFACAS